MSVILTDTKYIFTTYYPDYNEVERSHVQKTYTISGVAGKKIKLERLSLGLCVAVSGATASALVTAEVKGADSKVWESTSTALTYMPQESSPELEFPEGESVTLRFHLKTSNTVVKAKMNLPTVTYSMVDTIIPEPDEDPVPEPDPEPETGDPCLLVIECKSDASAVALKKAIEASGYLKDSIIAIYKEV